MGFFSSLSASLRCEIDPSCGSLCFFVLRDVEKQTPVACLWWGPRRSQLLIRRVPTGLRLSGCQSSAATWRCDRNPTLHYSHFNMAKLRKVADSGAEGSVKAMQANALERGGGGGQPIVHLTICQKHSRNIFVD